MKKPFILLAIFLFISSAAFSQDYYKGTYTSFTGTNDCLMEVCGDTVVDGKVYEFVHFTLFRADTIRFTIRYDEAIRKEGSKVYYRDVSRTESAEHLLYDYDLNVGESLTFTKTSTGEEVIIYTVDSIGTIDINGEIKKKIYIRDHDFDFAAQEDGYIIEDIGLIWQSRHPLYFVGVAFDHTWLFSCFYNSEGLVFSNPEDFNFLEACQEEVPNEICELNITSTKNQIDTQPLSVFPNPVNDVLNITTDSNSYLFKIHNASGQLIFAAENTKEYNFSQLPQGVYFLSAVDKTSGIIERGKVMKME